MERYTIREWKGLRGYTSEQLAEKCGVSRVTVANWMKDSSNIALKHAYKLAQAFGCSIEQILFFP